MKVKATNEYEKRNLQDAELKRVPKQGEIFEVSKERFEILNGKNRFNAVFVEKVEEVVVKDEVETTSKKTTKKK